MDNGFSWFGIGFVLSFFVMLFIHYAVLKPVLQYEIMMQAYERGHAVECLGKTGYYWECEE